MQFWWWSARPVWRSELSPEERKVIWLIHSIGMLLFAIACYEIVNTLFSRGVNPLITAIVGVVPPYIAALYVSRRLCKWLWPELLARADENAARRLGGPQLSARQHDIPAREDDEQNSA